MSYHDLYYQYGGGRCMNNVFIGSPRMRGHGLGSCFSGIFGSALPLLAKGARAVGKEALRTGINIIDDISSNDTSFKESLKTRLNESQKNLKRKALEKLNKVMEGSRYKTRSRKRHRQSRSVVGKIKVNNEKKDKITKSRRAGKKKVKTVKKRKTKREKKSKVSKVVDIIN